MNIVTALVAIVCGIFAASALSALLQRDRRATLDTLAAFQGYVGLPTAGWGAWAVFVSFWRAYQIQTNPIWWQTFLATAVAEVVLGAVLAGGLLARPRSAVRLGLSVLEVPLGLAAIALGGWCYVAAFRFHEFWS